MSDDLRRKIWEAIRYRKKTFGGAEGLVDVVMEALGEPKRVSSDIIFDDRNKDGNILWSEYPRKGDVCQAYLVCIEPIKKEEPECKHERQIILTRDSGEILVLEHYDFCPKCGKNLKND